MSLRSKSSNGSPIAYCRYKRDSIACYNNNVNSCISRFSKTAYISRFKNTKAELRLNCAEEPLKEISVSKENLEDVKNLQQIQTDFQECLKKYQPRNASASARIFLESRKKARISRICTNSDTSHAPNSPNGYKTCLKAPFHKICKSFYEEKIHNIHFRETGSFEFSKKLTAVEVAAAVLESSDVENIYLLFHSYISLFL